MEKPKGRSSAAPRLYVVRPPEPAHVLTIVDEVVVVALRGHLTEPSIPMVRAHLLSLVEFDGPDEIIIDLKGVQSMDEAGARPLLEAHRLQKRRNASLTLGETSFAAADFLESHIGIAETLAPLRSFPGRSEWLAEPT